MRNDFFEVWYNGVYFMLDRMLAYLYLILKGTEHALNAVWKIAGFFMFKRVELASAS